VSIGLTAGLFVERLSLEILLNSFITAIIKALIQVLTSEVSVTSTSPSLVCLFGCKFMILDSLHFITGTLTLKNEITVL
jgi:hypothetical protein